MERTVEVIFSWSSHLIEDQTLTSLEGDKKLQEESTRLDVWLQNTAAET